MRRLEFSSVLALLVSGILTVSWVEIFSEVALDGGPAFGSLRLNGERVECGSIAVYRVDKFDCQESKFLFIT